MDETTKPLPAAILEIFGTSEDKMGSVAWRLSLRCRPRIVQRTGQLPRLIA
jgi:hypothetical protein